VQFRRDNEILSKSGKNSAQKSICTLGHHSCTNLIMAVDILDAVKSL